MNELEAIYARHSVRSYESRKIEKDTAEALHAFLKRCNEEGDLHLQLLEDAGNTFARLLSKVMGLGTAPAVIACVGKDTPELDEKIGYYGQKAVLYAQTLGLNTCWAGTYSADKVPCVIRDGERLAIVIAIGYGTSQGRTRKSKRPDQVVRGGIEGKPEWFLKGTECALLAPTAINQQKFELVLNGDGTVTVEDKGGVLSGIDKGIVRCNFEIGAKH